MYEFTEAVSVELKIKNDCLSLCFVCVLFKGISCRGQYKEAILVTFMEWILDERS